MHRYIGEQTHTHTVDTDAQTHRCMDTQVDRHTNAQMHRWTDTQMHRHTDA